MKEKKYKVTVLMCVYNENSNLVHEAIQSIIQQDFCDFEFIIINDNPQYNELDKILEKYSLMDNRVKIYKNKINLGLTRSLNYGLSIAQGEYIARMDADDVSFKNRLSKQIFILDNMKNIEICGSNVNVINETGLNIGKYIYPEKNENILVKLIFRDCICHPSVMFRADAINEIGGYNEKYSKAQDYELWTRCIKNNYCIYNIQTPLLNYRKHFSNISLLSSHEQNTFSKEIRFNFLRAYVDELTSRSLMKILDGEVNLYDFFKIPIFSLRLIRKIKRSTKKVSFFYFYFCFFKRFFYSLMLKLGN